MRYLGPSKHRQVDGKTSMEMPKVMATKATTEKTVDRQNAKVGKTWKFKN